MAHAITVTLVEDDDDLRAVLERFLTGVGMEVRPFADTAGLDDDWQQSPPDVIVLDVNLPGESGFVAAARLRARSEVGIVMLTGRARQEDRLLGLSMGVDHYLAKPVDLRELESVIRNLARRTGATANEMANTRLAASETGSWTLDANTWRLVAPGGAAADLSCAEYQLLLPLLRHPGTPASRDAINARLGKPSLTHENRSLDVTVSRLRRKIAVATGAELPLRAARGSGYVFTGAARICDALALPLMA